MWVPDRLVATRDLVIFGFLVIHHPNQGVGRAAARHSAATT